MGKATKFGRTGDAKRGPRSESGLRDGDDEAYGAQNIADPAAVKLGRRGGKAAAGKGGRTRWAEESPEVRAELMRKVREAKGKAKKRR